MKPTLEQVLRYAETDLEQPKPPSPYEIALTLGAALLSAGRYADDPGAAMIAGWQLVIPYYQGQKAYEAHGQMLFELAKHASQAEGPMTPDEAYAYVTGGETGNIGEDEGGAVLAKVALGPASQTIDLEAAKARQTRIAETTLATQAAFTALEEAKATGKADIIAVAQQEFDQAAAEQSAAYL